MEDNLFYQPQSIVGEDNQNPWSAWHKSFSGESPVDVPQEPQVSVRDLISANYDEWAKKQEDNTIYPEESRRMALNEFNPSPQELQAGLSDPGFIKRFSKSFIEGLIPLGLIKFGSNKLGDGSVASGIESFTSRQKADTLTEKVAEISGGFAGTIAGFAVPMGIAAKAAGVFWKSSSLVNKLGKVGMMGRALALERAGVGATASMTAAKEAGLIAKMAGATEEATATMARFTELMAKASLKDKMLYHAIDGGMKNAIAFPLHSMLMADPEHNNAKDYLKMTTLTQGDAAMFTALGALTHANKFTAIASVPMAFAIGFGWGEDHQQVPKDERIIHGLLFGAMHLIGARNSIKELNKDYAKSLDDMAVPNPDALAQRVYEKLTDKENLPQLKLALEKFGKTPSEVEAIITEARGVAERREALSKESAKYIETVKAEDLVTVEGANKVAEKIWELDPKNESRKSEIDPTERADEIAEISDRLFGWGTGDQTAEASRTMNSLRAAFITSEFDKAIEARKTLAVDRMKDAEKNISSPESMSLLGKDLAKIVAPEAADKKLEEIGAKISSMLTEAFKSGKKGVLSGKDVGEGKDKGSLGVYNSAATEMVRLGKEYRKEKLTAIWESTSPEKLVSTPEELTRVAKEVYEASTFSRMPKEGEAGFIEAKEKVASLEKSILKNGVIDATIPVGERTIETTSAMKTAKAAHEKMLADKKTKEKEESKPIVEEKKPPINTAEWEAAKAMENDHFAFLVKDAKIKIADKWNAENPDKKLSFESIPDGSVPNRAELKAESRKYILESLGMEEGQYPSKKPAKTPEDALKETLLEIANTQQKKSNWLSEQRNFMKEQIVNVWRNLIPKRYSDERKAFVDSVFGKQKEIPPFKPVEDVVLRAIFETQGNIIRPTEIAKALQSEYGINSGVNPELLVAPGGAPSAVGRALKALADAGYIEVFKTKNENSEIKITKQGMDAIFSRQDGYAGQIFVKQDSFDGLTGKRMELVRKDGENRFIFKDLETGLDEAVMGWPERLMLESAFNSAKNFIVPPSSLDIFGPGSRVLSEPWSAGHTELANLAPMMMLSKADFTSRTEAMVKKANLKDEKASKEELTSSSRGEEINANELASSIAADMTGSREGGVLTTLAHSLAIARLAKEGSAGSITHKSMNMSSRDTTLKADEIRLNISTADLSSAEVRNKIAGDIAFLASEGFMPISVRKIAVGRAKGLRNVKEKSFKKSAQEAVSGIYNSLQNISDLKKSILSRESTRQQRLIAYGELRKLFSDEISFYTGKLKSFRDQIKKEDHRQNIESLYSRHFFRQNMSESIADRLASHLESMETDMVNPVSGKLVSSEIAKAIRRELDIEQSTKDVYAKSIEGSSDAENFSARIERAISFAISGKDDALFSGDREVRQSATRIMHFMERETSTSSRSVSLDDLMESINTAKSKDQIRAADAGEISPKDFDVQVTSKDELSGGIPSKSSDSMAGIDERIVATLASFSMPSQGSMRRISTVEKEPFNGVGQARARDILNMKQERLTKYLTDYAGLDSGTARKLSAMLRPTRASGSAVGADAMSRVIHFTSDQLASIAAIKEKISASKDRQEIKNLNEELDFHRGSIIQKIKDESATEGLASKESKNDKFDVVIEPDASGKDPVFEAISKVGEYMKGVVGEDHQSATRWFVRSISEDSRFGRVLLVGESDMRRIILERVKEERFENEGILSTKGLRLQDEARIISLSKAEQARAVNAIRVVSSALKEAGVGGEFFRQMGKSRVARGSSVDNEQLSMFDAIAFNREFSVISSSPEVALKANRKMLDLAKKAMKVAKTDQEIASAREMFKEARFYAKVAKAKASDSYGTVNIGNMVNIFMEMESASLPIANKARVDAIKDIRKVSAQFGIKIPKNLVEEEASSAFSSTGQFSIGDSISGKKLAPLSGSTIDRIADAILSNPETAGASVTKLSGYFGKIMGYRESGDAKAHPFDSFIGRIMSSLQKKISEAKEKDATSKISKINIQKEISTARDESRSGLFGKDKYQSGVFTGRAEPSKPVLGDQSSAINEAFYKTKEQAGDIEKVIRASDLRGTEGRTLPDKDSLYPTKDGELIDPMSPQPRRPVETKSADEKTRIRLFSKAVENGGKLSASELSTLRRILNETKPEREEADLWVKYTDVYDGEKLRYIDVYDKDPGIPVLPRDINDILKDKKGGIKGKFKGQSDIKLGDFISLLNDRISSAKPEELKSIKKELSEAEKANDAGIDFTSYRYMRAIKSAQESMEALKAEKKKGKDHQAKLNALAGKILGLRRELSKVATPEQEAKVDLTGAIDVQKERAIEDYKNSDLGKKSAERKAAQESAPKVVEKKKPKLEGRSLYVSLLENKGRLEANKPSGKAGASVTRRISKIDLLLSRIKKPTITQLRGLREILAGENDVTARIGRDSADRRIDVIDKMISDAKRNPVVEAPVETKVEVKKEPKKVYYNAKAVYDRLFKSLDISDKDFKVKRVALRKYIDRQELSSEESRVLSSWKVTMKDGGKEISAKMALSRSRIDSLGNSYRMQESSNLGPVTADVMVSKVQESAKRINGTVSGSATKDGETMTIEKKGMTINYTHDASLGAAGEVRQIVKDGKVVGYDIKFNPKKSGLDTIFHEGSEGHIAWDFMSKGERRAVSRFFKTTTEEQTVTKLAEAITTGRVEGAPRGFVSRLIDRMRAFVGALTGGRVFGDALARETIRKVESGKISEGREASISGQEARFHRKNPDTFKEFREKFPRGSERYADFAKAFQKREDRTVGTLSEFYEKNYIRKNKLDNKGEEFRKVIEPIKKRSTGPIRETIRGILSKNEQFETLMARIGLGKQARDTFVRDAAERSGEVTVKSHRFMESVKDKIRAVNPNKRVKLSDSTGKQISATKGQVFDIGMAQAKSAALDIPGVWDGINKNNWKAIDEAIKGIDKSYHKSIKRNIAKLAGVIGEDGFRKNPDGTIMLDPQFAKSYWTGYEMGKFSANDVKKMFERATPEEVDFYNNAVRPYYDKIIYPSLSKAYKEVNGKDLASEYNYVQTKRLWEPSKDVKTKSNPQTVTEQRTMDELMYRSLEDMSSLQGRGYSTSPVIMKNTANAMAASARETSQYAGFAKPVSEWRNALQQNKAAIIERVGPETTDTIFKMLDRFEGNVERVGDLERVMNKGLDRFTTATLGMNPAIALYQPISVLSYAREFGALNLAKAIAMRFTPEGNRIAKQIIENSYSLQERMLGSVRNADLFDTTAGRAEIEGVTARTVSRANAVQLMMKPIEIADRVAVKTGLLAAYFKGKEMGLSGDALIKYSASEGAAATHATQTSGLDVARTEWRSSANPWKRSLTFMSGGLNSSYNVVLRDLIAVRNNGFRSVKDVNNLAVSLSAVVTASAVISGIQTYKEYIVASEEDRKKLAKDTNRYMLNFAQGLAGHLPGSSMYANTAVSMTARALGDAKAASRYQSLESRNPYDMALVEWNKFNSARTQYNDAVRGYKPNPLDPSKRGDTIRDGKKKAKLAHQKMLRSGYRMMELITGMSGQRAFDQIEGLTR